MARFSLSRVLSRWEITRFAAARITNAGDWERLFRTDPSFLSSTVLFQACVVEFSVMQVALIPSRCASCCKTGTLFSWGFVGRPPSYGVRRAARRFLHHLRNHRHHLLRGFGRAHPFPSSFSFECILGLTAFSWFAVLPGSRVPWSVHRWRGCRAALLLQS